MAGVAPVGACRSLFSICCSTLPVLERGFWPCEGKDEGLAEPEPGLRPSLVGSKCTELQLRLGVSSNAKRCRQWIEHAV